MYSHGIEHFLSTILQADPIPSDEATLFKMYDELLYECGKRAHEVLWDTELLNTCENSIKDITPQDKFSSNFFHVAYSCHDFNIIYCDSRWYKYVDHIAAIININPTNSKNAKEIRLGTYSYYETDIMSTRRLALLDPMIHIRSCPFQDLSPGPKDRTYRILGVEIKYHMKGATQVIDTSNDVLFLFNYNNSYIHYCEGVARKCKIGKNGISCSKRAIKKPFNYYKNIAAFVIQKRYREYKSRSYQKHLNTWKSNISKVNSEILFLPNIGVEYFNALERFNKGAQLLT